MDERAAERSETLPRELEWRLREVEAAVSPEEIAELWVFPPLTDVDHSSEFLLFTRYLENERRRLYTARIPAETLAGEEVPPAGGASSNGRNGNGRHRATDGNGTQGRAGQEIRDHGTVPADRMPRFVEDFLRRLDGDGVEPIHVEVNGCRQRWFALLPGEVNGHGAPRANGHGTAGAKGHAAAETNGRAGGRDAPIR